jgi:HEPN domain-containing protein
LKNPSLVADYVKRCQARLKAIDALYGEKAWADVVRESQEVVELALKALLRFARIEVPRIHDVGDILRANASIMPAKAQPHLERMGRISHTLRRDRELAFYGSEDLTPSEFYKQEDATQARDDAAWVVSRVAEACAEGFRS